MGMQLFINRTGRLVWCCILFLIGITVYVVQDVETELPYLEGQVDRIRELIVKVAYCHFGIVCYVDFICYILIWNPSTK